MVICKRYYVTNEMKMKQKRDIKFEKKIKKVLQNKILYIKI